MKPGDIVISGCGHAFKKWRDHELPDYIGTLDKKDIGLVVEIDNVLHIGTGARVLFRGILGWIGCKNLTVKRLG